MDEGWIELTSEEDGIDLGATAAYRYREGRIYPHQIVDDIEDPRISELTTPELANIPWVKVLVEVGRAIQSEMGTGSDMDWHLRDSGHGQALITALKPFEGVDYE